MMKNLFKRGYQKELDVVEQEIVLDNQQFEIVHSNEKNIIVVAGAGSGKTRVLTERVKHLIVDLGVEPHNIVAITFTNLASEEMRFRLKDVPGIGDAFIGTIHSFANKLMQLSGEKYTLFTDAIDIDYHRELIEKYCRALTLDRYLQYRDIEKNVQLGIADESEIQNFLEPSEEAELHFIERNSDIVEAELAEGLYAYPETISTLCKERGVIDFNELLVRAKKYFESLNARIEHLLIDEFQDLGTLEFNFIDALDAEHNFFVGDDWQAIYGFKGGNVKIFLHFVEDSDFKVYYLTNNYRNCKEILDVAKTVIDQVDAKIPKIITTQLTGEGEVFIQTKSKIDRVLLNILDEKEYGDWFILCRANKEVYEIMGKCEALGVPSVTFKREGLTLKDMNDILRSNRVKIITVHSAKGLESDNVVLYGRFPLHTPNYMKNEDERKVMYVGITRAKKKLIIMN